MQRCVHMVSLCGRLGAALYPCICVHIARECKAQLALIAIVVCHEVEAHHYDGSCAASNNYT